MSDDQLSKAVSFSGKIEQIRMNDTRYNYPRIMFIYCLIDGVCKRHHMWVKLTKSQLAKVKQGDFITCRAVQYKYLNPDTLKHDKVGVGKLRDLNIYRKGKHVNKKSTT